MTIVQALADRGFSNAAVVADKDGITTVRVRTAKGWVYHRFMSVDQVAAWANYHEPEPQP